MLQSPCQPLYPCQIVHFRAILSTLWGHFVHLCAPFVLFAQLPFTLLSNPRGCFRELQPHLIGVPGNFNSWGERERPCNYRYNAVLAHYLGQFTRCIIRLHRLGLDDHARIAFLPCVVSGGDSPCYVAGCGGNRHHADD